MTRDELIQRAMDNEVIGNGRKQIRALLEDRVRMSALLSVVLDQIEDDPRAVQFFDIALVRQIKRAIGSPE